LLELLGRADEVIEVAVRVVLLHCSRGLLLALEDVRCTALKSAAAGNIADIRTTPAGVEIRRI
jgi:hypothetical protein